MSVLLFFLLDYFFSCYCNNPEISEEPCSSVQASEVVADAAWKLANLLAHCCQKEGGEKTQIGLLSSC